MRTEVRSTNDQHRQELVAFLQACRRRLTPEQVGLPVGERRRVKGLRREEVAALAGISITWYTWLEQGRPIQVSEATLDQLAQALRLSEAERAYLFLLAAPDPSPLAPLTERGSGEQVATSLQLLLQSLDPCPAHLRDQHWDILAWNQAEVGLHPWASLEREQRNLLWYLLIHPRPRQALLQWEEHTRAVMRHFRIAWGQSPPDQRFTDLRLGLQQTSREFRQWWQEYTVQQHPPTEIAWRWSNGEQISFSVVHLTLPAHPHLAIRVLLPQARRDPKALCSGS